MTKSKRGPALIELIHKKDSPGVKRPGWMGTQPGSSEPQVEDAPSASVVPALREEAESAESEATRFFTVRGDRVVLSFSSVSAGIVAFVLIAAIGAGYLLGRRSGVSEGLEVGFREGVSSVQAGAMGEIEAARRSTPNPDVFAGLASNPLKPQPAEVEKTPATQGKSEPNKKPPAESPWVTGHTYIIVQDFKAEDEADVTAAQQFLRDQGIDTAVLESKGTYKYRLVATKGFNREDATQKQWCDEYHDRIKELGKLFVKAGGRYDLKGYQKKVTGPGW